jgi:hypothetical protein
MIDVRGRIAAALESRRANQGRIDRLYDAWLALTRSVDTLAETISETSARIAGLEQRTGEGLTPDDGLSGDWGAGELHELRHAIAELTPDIVAIRARFHRPTVNIGVVGQAAAGKSTLLRTITGLDEVVIPSGGLKPTTAARSRIQHSLGRSDATVMLRTWEEFRDGYLRPLHTDAGCEDSVPSTPDEFIKYPYQDALEAARGRSRHAPDAERAPVDQQKFLRRLRTAQVCFPSYRDLLEQPARELRIDQLTRLRPFVAYPSDDSHARPYHAVHDVWIYCEFSVGDVENLVLVDLPGAGEAALNIEQQFLADLRNDVDVLLQVKRPVVSRSWIGEDDWRVFRLADKASMGVDRGDFVSFVINTDPANVTQDQLDNAVAEAQTEITQANGLQLLIGDVASEDQVRERILGPVLEGLARRLAIMDQTAAATQIRRARAVAERVHAVADRLAGEVRRRERLVPDEDSALRNAAKQLRNSVSKRLDALLDEYDRLAAEHHPVPELAKAITLASGNLTRWADSGFGMGSKKEWLAKVEDALSADLGETRDDQCTRARRQIRQEFGRIDSSLTDAVDRLHTQVARALPPRLIGTQGAGEQPLHALAETADRLRLASLHEALRTLLEIRDNYGNVFLRVGGPVVDRVAPAPGPLPGEGAAVVPGAGPGDGGAGGGTQHAFYRGAQLAADVVGAMHPAAGPAAHAAANAVPLVLGWIWEAPITDRSAESLNVALSRAFREAVGQIEKRMQEEAGQLSEVLAAALNQFKDDFIRAPEIEREWAELCRPARHELWPRTFGGEAATLTAGYRKIAGAVSAGDAAAGAFLAASNELPDAGR